MQGRHVPSEWLEPGRDARILRDTWRAGFSLYNYSGNLGILLGGPEGMMSGSESTHAYRLRMPGPARKTTIWIAAIVLGFGTSWGLWLIGPTWSQAGFLGLMAGLACLAGIATFWSP